MIKDEMMNALIPVNIVWGLAYDVSSRIYVNIKFEERGKL